MLSLIKSMPIYTKETGKEVEGIFRLIIKEGIDPVAKRYPGSYVQHDINDMILAYRAWMEDDKRYKFYHNDFGLSVVHFVTFSLLSAMVVLLVEEKVEYEKLLAALRVDFLTHAGKAGYDNTKLLEEAFDSTMRPETITMWYHIVSLMSIGEVPY